MACIELPGPGDPAAAAADEVKGRSQLRRLLAATVGDLCDALVEESREFESIIHEDKAARTPRPSTLSGSRKNSEADISSQSILQRLNDSISIMKSVNLRVREELTRSVKTKSLSSNELDSKILADKTTQTEQSRFRNEDDDSDDEESVDVDLWKLQSQWRKAETEIESKERLESQALDFSSSSILTGDLKGEASEGRGSGGRDNNRVQELELQLKRMEYRARNAEDRCDLLKTELNQTIVELTTKRNSEIMNA